MLQEGINFSGNANNPASFTLVCGGKYAVGVNGANFGTVELQVLGPDGNYLSIKANEYTGSADADVVIGSFAAAGMKVLDLPPGTYKFVISSATTVAAFVARCPQA